MYNLVSPMDYGSSARSNNVRRRRNKAIGMFLTDQLALPLLKSLGHVAWNLIKSHYGGYLEDEIFAQRLQMMNASEMIREFNLTLPLDAVVAAEDEESRPNMTMTYIHDGESRQAVLYKRYSAAFAPYEDYSNKYYTRDGDFQQSTFPADSYPWLCITMKANDIQALEQIQVQLQEFFFDTGIPRFTMSSNGSHVAFPSLEEFLQTSEADYVIGGIGNVTDFSTRRGVYAALTHFYAYPSVLLEGCTEEVGDCIMKRPWLVQSGVTVYTPSLTTLTVFQTFADKNVAPATKRAVRMAALLEMVQVAFEAERRALNHGLQSPSTVWYSNHDLDVDEFADAILGTVNMSIGGDSGDSTPLHVFKKHMNEHVPILDEVVSYYADTNHDTTILTEHNHSIPKLDKFEESELVELVGLLDSQMKNLDRSIVSYVKTRDATPLYQEVVSVTIRGDFYNGSQYTLVGFGFILPATNSKNVLYRDMKLPVPFHLALRLIVRFQESRLLLPEESRQLLVCLAMAFYNISFYRCRPSGE
ncbi:Hypothetical protein PHPALM_17968 [Phytophthora palmivora]|uniref:Uncharacterized protein n=1 Tax=Phytophthora palmivora TaxID=4796 RepID=A0A2P4XL39_9STRA|nr:Hypothetical protein PHPALM_17968 [Phytophthora palmivora]